MNKLYLTILAIFLSMACHAIVGPITGTNTICLSGTTTLADTTAGGIWSSSSPAYASVGSTTGIVTGVATGTATITYTAGASYVTMPVTINALPVQYTVTGGSYCSTMPGGTITLPGSEPGISYQLYYGSTPTGSPQTGSGPAIDWGPFTATGTYTVSAINLATGCTRDMGGSGGVTANAAPAVFTFSATGSTTLCSGSTAPMTLSGSQVGINYYWPMVLLSWR